MEQKIPARAARRPPTSRWRRRSSARSSPAASGPAIRSAPRPSWSSSSASTARRCAKASACSSRAGLVRRDSSRRLWIGLPHYERLATRMSRALVLHKVTFRELYEAAMPMQIATIEAAVERATPELDRRARGEHRAHRGGARRAGGGGRARRRVPRPDRQGVRQPGAAARARALRDAGHRRAPS